MILRTREWQRLMDLLRRHRIVGIIGARQVGKTTLARALAARLSGPRAYFDLENPEDAARLAEPMLALKPLRGLIIIDEIQRRPELYPVLRVLADRPRGPARFLLLGSASPDLMRRSSETLAGRIVYHELGGLALDEVGQGNLSRLWLRGGFPRAYTARTLAASAEWRRAFVQMFLERDIPQLGITVGAATLRRFWTMLAHYHGQVWNASAFAQSFGVADTTVRHYLNLLTGALVLRQLQPWQENLAKRQVRSPKVYVVDSGLLHTLLGVTTQHELDGHPKVGASWEGFALAQVIRQAGARPEECYFWRTHAGAELDLLIVRGTHRMGFEIKRTAAPQVTPAMRIALHDLKLRRLDVIHAGDETFPLAERIRAVALRQIETYIRPF